MKTTNANKIKQLERELKEANDYISLLEVSIKFTTTNGKQHLFDVRSLLTDVELCDLNKIPLSLLYRLQRDKKVDYFLFQTNNNKSFTLYPRTKKNLTLFSKRARYQHISDIVYDNERFIQ